ncbi:hypothetical protein ACOSP7_022401 [Xanthoceras sorbifolium]
MFTKMIVDEPILKSISSYGPVLSTIIDPTPTILSNPSSLAFKHLSSTLSGDSTISTKFSRKIKWKRVAREAKNGVARLEKKNKGKLSLEGEEDNSLTKKLQSDEEFNRSSEEISAGFVNQARRSP